jgi:sulfonate transport system ATP-binding protein
MTASTAAWTDDRWDSSRSVTPSGAAAQRSSAVRSTRGMQIQIDQLSKQFGGREVLRRTSLTVEPGEFVAIVGRSGCGKSTLLRLVAGLETLNGGDLRLDGQSQQGLHQDVRIMFQEARLLPWRKVIDNVALGLPDSSRPVAEDVLAQVGLGDRRQEWPSQLSGGQRQRVALARALVHRPRLLLLDEPLGALDALTCIEMHRLIESLWLTHGFTALLVTHDVQEAVALADRVVLIEQGQITLDERIDVARPRSAGSPGFARHEQRILERVLAA